MQTTEEKQAPLADRLSIVVNRMKRDGMGISAGIVQEASAEIERLQAEIERLRKATEWQPASTMPQDEDTQILISGPRGVFSCSVRFARELSQPAHHWMPLPVPPTE